MTKIGSTRTYSTDGPECPYCGFTFTPDDPFFYDDRYTQEECPECDRKFKVEVRHSVSWACDQLD